MVGLGGRTEDFGEDGFQSVGPNLIRLEGRVKLVWVDHAGEIQAVGVRQFVVDVEVSDPLAIRKMLEVPVDLIDGGNCRQVVISGKDRGEDDRGLRRFGAAGFQDGCDSTADVVHLLRIPGFCPDIVDPGQHDDDFWVYPVEFTILKPPEDVLDAVGPPAEVGHVPTEEVGLPVFKQRAVAGVRRAPTSGNRVTDEEHINAPLAGLGEKLFVREAGVGIGAGDGLGGGGGAAVRREVGDGSQRQEGAEPECEAIQGKGPGRRKQCEGGRARPRIRIRAAGMARGSGSWVRSPT